MAPKAAKGEKYAAELDLARASADHEAIPELVRKTKKHNPALEKYGEVALLESRVNQAIEAAELKAGGEKQYGGDGGSKGKISMPAWVGAGQVETDHTVGMDSMIERLEQVAGANMSQGEDDDDNDDGESFDDRGTDKTVMAARYALARAQMYMGNEEQTLAALRGCILDSRAKVEPNYSFVVMLHAIYAKGLALEKRGKLELASKVYEEGARLIDQGRDFERTHVLIQAAEDILYRNAILKVTTRTAVELQLGYLKTYLRYLPHNRYGSYRTTKRMVILKTYSQVLHRSSREGGFMPEDGSAETAFNAKKTRKSSHFHEEYIMAAVQTMSHLEKSSSFPRAGRINSDVLEYTDTVMANWIISGSPSQHAKTIIDLFYRCMTLTFQSQRIQRHLILLLASHGDYDECRRALAAYVSLVKKGRETDSGAIDRQMAKKGESGREGGSVEKDFNEEKDHDEEAYRGRPRIDREDDELGPAILYGAGMGKSGTEDVLHARDDDSDTDSAVIGTLIVGIRMMIKYCDPRHSHEALAYAEYADKLAMENDRICNDRPALSKVKRALGIAHVFAADSDMDPDTRPDHHAEALHAFQEATILDPTSIDAQYYLAQHLATIRQVKQAVEAARTALEIDQTHLPSFHLLGLLLTATREFKNAKEILELGIEQGELAVQEIEDAEEGIVADDSDDDEEGDDDDGEDEYQVDDGNEDAGSFERDVLRSGMKRRDSPDANRSTRQDDDDDDSIEFEDAQDQAQDDHERPQGQGTKDMPRTGTRLEEISDFPVVAVDLFEQLLNLMMTRAVLAEHLDGPEEATIEQQQLFVTYSRFFGSTAPKFTPEGPANGKPDKRYSMVLNLDNRSTTGLSGSTAVGGAPTNSNSITGNTTVSEPGQMESRDGGGRDRRLSETPTDGSVGPIKSLIHLTLEPAEGSIGTDELERRRDFARDFLVSLWLASAATFHRTGQYTESLAAINEAENVDASNAAVWAQFGITLYGKKFYSRAITSFHKSLALAPRQISAHVHLANLHITAPFPHYSLEVAEGLLESLTKGNGWDVPEAWYLLGNVMEKTGRKERAKMVWLYAIQLEESKGIRPWRDVLPRFL